MNNDSNTVLTDILRRICFSLSIVLCALQVKGVINIHWVLICLPIFIYWAFAIVCVAVGLLLVAAALKK